MKGLHFQQSYSHIFEIWGSRGGEGGGGKNNSVIADFKNVTIFITLSGPNVPIHFRRTLIEGFIR